MEQEFDREDWEQNRTLAALGYMVFFVPLILCPKSKLGRYCANQGLLLTVLIALVSILFGILSAIPLIGWLFRIIGGVVSFALFGVGLVCFVQMMTNERVITLPYIGEIQLIH